MRGPQAVIIALIALCAGCESVPHLGGSPTRAAGIAPTLLAVTDARSPSARISLVERSGSSPIILLGDERFELTPIEMLERKLLASGGDVPKLVVHRFDVRYKQGGGLNELDTALSLGASVITPVLGSLLYGGMSAKARRDAPSRVEFTVDCIWKDQPLTVKFQQDLIGSSENDALRDAVNVAVDRVIDALRRHQQQ